jgi:predicted dehydrogenase
VEITTWLDVEREKSERFARQYGGRVADRWKQVLDDETIEGVVIALPHDLHHQYGVEAARAGKHILMEIPVAATVEQADEVLAAAQEAGVVLLVLHSLRFWRSHQYVKELLDSGVLGQPFFARYHNEHTVPADYWARRGGHLAAEAGILHHGDVMRWWVGEVEALTARGLRFEAVSQEHGTLDHITVLYDLEGGALGETTCSWITRQCELNRMVRGSVSGTEGTVVLTWNDEVRVYSERGALPGGHRFMMTHPARTDGPEGEIVHFAECVRLGKEPLVSPWDARRALELTLAARDSARTGQRIKWTGR